MDKDKLLQMLLGSFLALTVVTLTVVASFYIELKKEFEVYKENVAKLIVILENDISTNLVNGRVRGIESQNLRLEAVK